MLKLQFTTAKMNQNVMTQDSHFAFVVVGACAGKASKTKFVL